MSVATRCSNSAHPLGDEGKSSDAPKGEGDGTEGKGSGELLSIIVGVSGGRGEGGSVGGGGSLTRDLGLELGDLGHGLLEIALLAVALVLGVAAALVANDISALALSGDGVLLDSPLGSGGVDLEHLNALEGNLADRVGDTGEAEDAALLNGLGIVEVLEEGNEEGLLLGGFHEGEVLAGVDVGHGNDGPGEFAGLVEKVDGSEVGVGAVGDGSGGGADAALLGGPVAGEVGAVDVLELDLLEALGMAVAGIDVADGAGDFLEALGHAARALAFLGSLGPVDGLANEGGGPLRGTGGVEVLRGGIEKGGRAYLYKVSKWEQMHYVCANRQMKVPSQSCQMQIKKCELASHQFIYFMAVLFPSL